MDNTWREQKQKRKWPGQARVFVKTRNIQKWQHKGRGQHKMQQTTKMSIAIVKQISAQVANYSNIKTGNEVSNSR